MTCQNLIQMVGCLCDLGIGYLFFVEVDLGTEDTGYIRKKVDAYRPYYSSRRWVNERWATIFKSSKFPTVLFFTENNRLKRRKSFEEYTEGSLITFKCGFHESFKKDLKNLLEGQLHINTP